MSAVRKNFLKPAIVVLVALTILGPVAALYLFTGGMVVGEEFNPDDFTRRRFFYNKMPLFGWTLYGLELTPSTPVMEQNLVVDGWIQPTGAPRWDLIYDSTTSLDQTRDCDARILTQYLDLMTIDRENLWVAWNREHPALGPIFWPAIADLARAGLYVDTPEAMRLAMNFDTDDAVAFRERLNPMIGSALKRAGIQAEKDGDIQRAISLLEKSLKYQPDERVSRRVLKLKSANPPNPDG